MNYCLHNPTLQASDPDGDPITFVRAVDPDHGLITNWVASVGTFTYNPTANYYGTDRFTYIATDGTLVSNTATVCCFSGLVKI